MGLSNSLINTRTNSVKTKSRLSKIILSEFVKPIPDLKVAELVLTAIQFDLPEVDEMLDTLNLDPIIEKYYGYKS